MKAIVNVDSNWGIGNGDSLLNYIPADMKFLRLRPRATLLLWAEKLL